MSYWNYRVIREYDEEYNTYLYDIHGVHYNDEGVIHLWTDHPASPFGNDLEELKHDLELYTKAIDKPVLEIIVEGDVEKLVEVEENG